MSSEEVFEAFAQLDKSLRQSVAPQQVRHNKVNHSNFQAFQARFENNHKNIESKLRKNVIRENLGVFAEEVPPRFAHASLPELARTNGSEETKWVLARLNNPSQPISFYLGVTSGYDNVMVAYAILRRYVGLGFLSPKQMVHIEENDIITLAKAGFHGAQDLQKLITKQTRAVIFSASSLVPSYSLQEDNYLSKIIDTIYKSNLTLLVTSPLPFDEWVEKFSLTTENHIKNIIQPNNILNPQPQRHTTNTPPSIWKD